MRWRISYRDGYSPVFKSRTASAHYMRQHEGRGVVEFYDRSARRWVKWSEEVDPVVRFKRAANPKRRRARVHTAIFDRCVEDVKRTGRAVNPDAVCMASLGERRAVLKGHRRRRNPRPAGRPYIIAAQRSGRTLFYADGAKLIARGRVRKFDSRRDAEAMVYLLKHSYARALAGWRLRILPR